MCSDWFCFWTYHTNREVIVDDIIWHILSNFKYRLRFVSFLILDAYFPSVQHGSLTSWYPLKCSKIKFWGNNQGGRVSISLDIKWADTKWEHSIPNISPNSRFLPCMKYCTPYSTFMVTHSQQLLYITSNDKIMLSFVKMFSDKGR